MKSIWAPWRAQFIYKRKRKGCIFCKAYKAKKDKKYFVVARNKTCFAMLNIYPYNNGHIMVASNRHVSSLAALREKEILDFMSLVQGAIDSLKKTLKPDGFNLGLNLGKVAGAGFPGHIHMHIVPRWQGDTNFMPVITDTKVLSESLDSLYKKLGTKIGTETIFSMGKRPKK